jgi:hypothetical protein
MIARTYYSADDDVHASTPGVMERYLRVCLTLLSNIPSNMDLLFWSII